MYWLSLKNKKKAAKVSSMSPTLHGLLHQAHLSTSLGLLMLVSHTAPTPNTKTRRLMTWTLTVLYLHADRLYPHPRLSTKAKQNQWAIRVHYHRLPRSSTLRHGLEVTMRMIATTMTTHNQCSLLTLGFARRGEHSLQVLVQNGYFTLKSMVIWRGEEAMITNGDPPGRWQRAKPNHQMSVLGVTYIVLRPEDHFRLDILLLLLRKPAISLSIGRTQDLHNVQA